MKITEVPPTPARPTYRLELTFDELVTLGVLSHRHELRNDHGDTFLRRLPAAVAVEASQRASTVNVSQRDRGLGGGGTYTSVRWGEE